MVLIYSICIHIKNTLAWKDRWGGWDEQIVLWFFLKVVTSILEKIMEKMFFYIYFLTLFYLYFRK